MIFSLNFVSNQYFCIIFMSLCIKFIHFEHKLHNSEYSNDSHTSSQSPSNNILLLFQSRIFDGFTLILIPIQFDSQIKIIIDSLILFPLTMLISYFFLLLFYLIFDIIASIRITVRLPGRRIISLIKIRY